MTSIEWFRDEILIHLNYDQRLYLKEIFEQAKERYNVELSDQYLKGYEAGLFYDSEND